MKTRCATGVAFLAVIATAGFIVETSVDRTNELVPNRMQWQEAHLAVAFKEGFEEWRPIDGVRSPCPQLQDQVSITLLKLHRLQNAERESVIAVTGRPMNVFFHRETGIEYWMTCRYWVAMAPNCQMLLPRNANYDSMMKMAMNSDTEQDR